MLDEYNDWRLLELFFRKPLYPYHLREICRTLGWSPTKVRLTIERLKRRGLVTENREKNLSLFRSNREDLGFKEYKKIYNIMKAFKIAKAIEEELEDYDAIILFGSASRGEDVEGSDYDLCIIGAEEASIPLEKFEAELNRKVSLLFIEDLEELKRQGKELLNNLINGFIVKGYLKVF